ncbi:MAG: hypothetical protein KDB53_06305 [Planctomycetes bacterium]|nr:hypothetical protein [Planctomycetota bacterium]
MKTRILFGFFVFAIALQAPAQGPVVTEVSPTSASPGQEITITGVFSPLATHVRFTASVGGFLGIDNRIVVVNSATATQVKVTVPTMAGFAPPNATPPGDPFGSFTVRDAGGIMSASTPFFYHQGAFLDGSGQMLSLMTTGLGSTNSQGNRAASSFALVGGPPDTVAGNPNFNLMLDNATPFSASVLVAGAPANPPSIMLGDGLVAIDLAQPTTLFPSASAFLFTDAVGELAVPLPIPPGGPLFITFTVMYVYFDASTLQPHISNGLSITI